MSHQHTHSEEHAPHGHHTPQTRGRTMAGAARWYDLRVFWLTLGGEKRLRRRFLALADLKPGEQVLDVGCGTGTSALMAEKFVQPGGAVVGIDATPEMIEVAQKKAAKQKAPVRFEVGLIEAIPADDGTFDVAMNSLVMHHLPLEEQAQGVVEMLRVLKPGGRLLIVDYIPGSGGIVDRVHGTHHLKVEPDWVVHNLVAGHGYVNVEMGTIRGGMRYVRANKPR